MVHWPRSSLMWRKTFIENWRCAPGHLKLASPPTFAVLFLVLFWPGISKMTQIVVHFRILRLQVHFEFQFCSAHLTKGRMVNLEKRTFFLGIVFVRMYLIIKTLKPDFSEEQSFPCISLKFQPHFHQHSAERLLEKSIVAFTCKFRLNFSHFSFKPLLKSTRF